MMKLLAPLGFLGLLSLIALIIIYIIKPNYQHKETSSTFIWSRALKYRKKRIPISRITNIIILICQILILALCSWIFVRPVIAEEVPESKLEKIMVIDASGNMRASDEGETRFERAVNQALDLAHDVMSKKGSVTVIVADDDPYYLAQKSVAADRYEFDEMMNGLIADKNMLGCSYGQADMDKAMELAQAALDQNADAEVLLYTATKYLDKGKVTVKDVSEVGEWNAAILGCNAKTVENYYTFSIDVACYGMDKELWVYCDVYGANADKAKIPLGTIVHCNNDKVQTIVFNTANTDTPIYSYDYLHVHIDDVDDSLQSDNDYYLFGGTKETVKVQYYSPRANDFFAGWLLGAREILSSRWSIELKEVTLEEPAYSGFDFYIFEHAMPPILPSDGVVLLVDLDVAPNGSGLLLGESVAGDFTLAPGEPHDATRFITAENVTITEYKRILQYSASYTPLMYCGGDPIYLVCNEPDYKIAVLSLNLNKSNLSVLIDFPILMYNMFNYYLPSTVSSVNGEYTQGQYVFDVNSSVGFNARGSELKVNGPEFNEVFTEFPQQATLSTPGLYTLTQSTLRNESVTENIFVKIPESESNIAREVDSLKYPIAEVKTFNVLSDLIIYFAIAMFVLLFVEWILQAREYFS